MQDPTNFMHINKRNPSYRPVSERVKDYREVEMVPSTEMSQEQASRCMDCGVAFCHWQCPVGSNIPLWNHCVAEGEWEKAYYLLQQTNNMPEMTGRLCPAPCEPACVLAKERAPVSNREVELAIMERAFQEGWVHPKPPAHRTGKTVAVIGSGPAGLSCAAELNAAGHTVVVFERDAQVGGLLRYGIPDFKLEKWVIDRRVDIWKAEGVTFRTGVHVGVDYPIDQLQNECDAICLTGGARAPRDLPIDGRDLHGIHFAMEFLTQSNERVGGATVPPADRIDAQGKHVVVIGGGDTGSDCVGTSHRQGATQVTQLELLSRPPEEWDPFASWPDYPVLLRTSSSHAEGGNRDWSVLTKAFLGTEGHVTTLSCVKVEWVPQAGAARPAMREIPGSAFELTADLVLLAMGFVSPEQQGLLSTLDLRRDARGNVATDAQHRTSIEGVFAAGDMHRGQSLVVWAIQEGRTAAHYMNHYLQRLDQPAMTNAWDSTQASVTTRQIA